MTRIYVETSVPSFYYEVRTEPGMVAMTQWTRQSPPNSNCNRSRIGEKAFVSSPEFLYASIYG